MSKLVMSRWTRAWLPAALGLLLLTTACAQAASSTNAGTAANLPDCNRNCLHGLLDTYLGAVFRHDPGAAPLAQDNYATEDALPVATGDGFWKDVTGYGDLQRRYFDPVTGSASYFGSLKRGDQDIIASVRIRVQAHQITEAEWLIARQGLGAQSTPRPDGLAKHPPPVGSLPASQRTSRLMMISLANDYYQAVRDHDGSWVPTSADCIRIENGSPAPAQPDGEPVKGKCTANFEGFRHLTKETMLRRFPVVDEESGMVLGSTIFVRYPTSPARHNLVHEYFLIRYGKIAGIWTSMYYLPPGTPLSNGWEDREDK